MGSTGGVCVARGATSRSGRRADEDKSERARARGEGGSGATRCEHARCLCRRRGVRRRPDAPRVRGVRRAGPGSGAPRVWALDLHHHHHHHHDRISHAGRRAVWIGPGSFAPMHSCTGRQMGSVEEVLRFLARLWPRPLGGILSCVTREA
eukprot:scaffold422_cov399-Prasinococcus_capsulatus_cf.AAC.14